MHGSRLPGLLVVLTPLRGIRQSIELLRDLLELLAYIRELALCG